MSSRKSRRGSCGHAGISGRTSNTSLQASDGTRWGKLPITVVAAFGLKSIDITTQIKIKVTHDMKKIKSVNTIFLNPPVPLRG
jgi:hypothetical protein